MNGFGSPVGVLAVTPEAELELGVHPVCWWAVSPVLPHRIHTSIHPFSHLGRATGAAAYVGTTVSVGGSNGTMLMRGRDNTSIVFRNPGFSPHFYSREGPAEARWWVGRLRCTVRPGLALAPLVRWETPAWVDFGPQIPW